MDDALFNLNGTGASESASAPANTSNWISAEEISKIRSAFTQANINEQEERKDFIQRTLGREISSLKEVSSHEVSRLLYRINDVIFAAMSSSGDTRSAWDDREEDTWIDKL